MPEPRPKNPDDGSEGLKQDARADAKPAGKPEGKPGEKPDWTEKK